MPQDSLSLLRYVNAETATRLIMGPLAGSMRAYRAVLAFSRGKGQ